MYSVIVWSDALLDSLHEPMPLKGFWSILPTCSEDDRFELYAGAKLFHQDSSIEIQVALLGDAVLAVAWKHFVVALEDYCKENIQQDWDDEELVDHPPG